MSLSKELTAYQWALPEGLEVPPDELKARLDFYQDTIILYLLDRGVVTAKVVSARDIALALLGTVPLRSGLLPRNTLWWAQGKEGVEVAIWQPPTVKKVALQLEAFKPPKRFKLPLPGLIFICSPGRAPRVYAAKRRPKGLEDEVYHAPLFNLFWDGRSCPGTHKYPEDVSQIPHSFFQSFFTPTADTRGRSKKYPDDLLKLWEELDGKKRYPLSDLVLLGKIEEVMK